MPDKAGRLLDPQFLRRLERLRIAARRAFPGVTRGERRSPRRGSSVEFADFRKYEVGDDFRHIDWSIYARLDRLVLRQFRDEEDVRIDILVDQSRSMFFGEPATKFDCARRVAAAIAFLAITSHDRVGVAAFDSAIRARLRALRGRAHLISLLSFLDGLAESDGESDNGMSPPEPGRSSSASSPTNLSAVLKGYQHSVSKPGILFVISDFLAEDDFQAQMRLLTTRGFELNLIQVLAPDEVKPALGGDLLLVDSETGEAKEVTVNERMLAAYSTLLATFTTSLESFSRSNGMGYTRISADAEFEEVLVKHLIEGRMAE